MPGGEDAPDCKQLCSEGEKLSQGAQESKDGGESGDAVSPAIGQVTADNSQQGNDNASVEQVGGGSGDASVKPEPAQDPAALPDGTPMWVKSRGKWRAAVKCSTTDCKLSTLKSAPTHRAKAYILVYIPGSYDCQWICSENVCPIDENPTPLMAGTHESGRQSVKDPSILKNNMILMLALEILDISDQLPLKAVDSSARDVKFWKAFASEAGKCTSYSELGSFLPRLHAKILPGFITPNWTKTRYHKWKKDCECSMAASAVETLTQELIGAVLWDKVKKLWSSSKQTELTSSEWQHWKGTIFEGLHQQISAADVKSEAQVPNFPGVETTPVRARGPNFATGLTPMNVTGYDTNLGQALPTKKELAVDVAAGATGHLQGSSYPSTSASINESEEHTCEGTRKLGGRCSHKTKGGAKFCGKHLHLGSANEILRFDAPVGDLASRSGRDQETGSTLKRKRSSGVLENNSGLFATNALTAGPQEGQGRRPDIVNAQGICRGWSRRTNSQCARKAGKLSLYCHKHMIQDEQETVNVVNNKPTGDTVTGLAHDSSTYKEQKDLDRAKNLLHGFLSAATVSQGSLPDNAITEAAKERLIREASEDLCMAESLLMLTSLEQERLREEPRGNQQNIKQPESPQACLPGDGHCPVASFERPVESSTPADEQKFSVALDAMGEPCVIVTAQRQLLSCALCEQKFDQKADLSTHWLAQHKKQASLFLKGPSCRVCRFEASSAPGIERHWGKQHQNIPLDWPCWSICISCDKASVNEVELWEHVANMHSEQLTRQANHDGGPDTWRPLQCSVQAGQQEMTLRCATSYKEVTSDLELSDPEDGEPANMRTGEIMPSSGSGMNEHVTSARQSEDCHLLQSESTRFEVGSPEHCNTGSDVPPYDSGLLAHVSPKPLRVKEKKVASRGRGRGRKAVGLNGRRQSTGSESETALTPSELFLKRRRLKLTARGQFEHQEEDASCSGRDASPGLICGSTASNNRVGALCNTEQGMDGGNSSVEVKGYAQDYAYVLPATKQHASVDDTVRAGMGNDENSLVKLKTNLLCNEELDAPANKARCIVLSQDISSGQEPVLVPCVVNIDVLQPCTCTLCQEEKECDVSKLRPWESFVYVTKRLVDPSLGIDTKEFQLGCSCGQGNCAPELCDHVKMFDNDNHDACDLNGRPMRGRFPYDRDGRIIVQEGFLVYECNSSCHCSKQCENRVLQNGVHVKLEVYKTRHKGWAVRAAQSISRGTFVCEYIGEVLNNEEANQRGQRYDQLGCSYLYDIDVHLDASDGLSSKRQPYVIDATKYGNVSRFINHSCSPNLVNYQVLIESMDCRLAHIGLYASREIAVGEELAYDYRYKLLPGKGCLCQCGSTTCRGRLY